MNPISPTAQRSRLYPAGQRNAFREILVPTDFSSLSNRAADYAVELARRLASHVTLLHVVPAPFALDYALGGIPNGDWEKVRQRADRKLEAALQRAKTRYEQVDTLVRTGSDLHEEIAGAATEVDADLVVLSTHRYKGWKRLIYGSDTDDLLYEIPCPVMVVR
jgi:nucleotide-binding universal stress UspA family protein